MVALDVLRGIAVLGILTVNMQGFARVPSAYMNPTSGAEPGAGLALWSAIHLLADTKFLSIFSMLFGAGMVIVGDRSAAGGSRAAFHYRRQLWLLVIGLVHAYLIWHGDILVVYALCGLILYRCRTLSPGTLLWVGALLVAIVVPLWAGLGWSLPLWSQAERSALAAEWAPPPGVLASQIEAFRGGWSNQLPLRAAQALELQTAGALGALFWRSGGMMLLGMGLYKLGVLSGNRPRSFYRRMAVVGLAAGLPVCAVGVAYNIHADFSLERSMFFGPLFNYVGSVGVCLGYVALAMLLVKGAAGVWFADRLAAVGRMALTNYIGQSVLATWIFYGHGLGLFERVGPPGQMAVVAGIWALQLGWSPWWLARFRFGPLEWLWRSLSYRRWQPMRYAA